MSVVSVYVVFANSEEAEHIGRLVVEERLAACANVMLAMRSIYRWEGKLETAEEVAAVFKTTDASVDRLMTRIAGLHSYEVPCIVVWPIDKILASYANWVADNVG